MFSILTLLSSVLIAILLMSMLARARPLIKSPLPGRQLQTLPMGLFSRFQLQRSTLLALLLGLIFGTATGWLPASTAGIVATLALLTLLIPMQYIFTTQGVGVGEGLFYPWKEFSSFRVGVKKLELHHPCLFGRLTLYVKSAELTDVLHHIERHVKTGK